VICCSQHVDTVGIGRVAMWRNKDVATMCIHDSDFILTSMIFKTTHHSDSPSFAHDDRQPRTLVTTSIAATNGSYKPGKKRLE
jgi:hypothetical protein